MRDFFLKRRLTWLERKLEANTRQIRRHQESLAALQNQNSHLTRQIKQVKARL